MWSADRKNEPVFPMRTLSERRLEKCEHFPQSVKPFSHAKNIFIYTDLASEFSASKEIDRCNFCHYLFVAFCSCDDAFVVHEPLFEGYAVIPLQPLHVRCGALVLNATLRVVVDAWW